MKRPYLDMDNASGDETGAVGKLSSRSFQRHRSRLVRRYPCRDMNVLGNKLDTQNGRNVPSATERFPSLASGPRPTGAAVMHTAYRRGVDIRPNDHLV